MDLVAILDWSVVVHDSACLVPVSTVGIGEVGGWIIAAVVATVVVVSASVVAATVLAVAV